MDYGIKWGNPINKITKLKTKNRSGLVCSLRTYIPYDYVTKYVIVGAEQLVNETEYDASC